MVIYWDNDIFFAFGYDIWEKYWVKKQLGGKRGYTYSKGKHVYHDTYIYLFLFVDFMSTGNFISVVYFQILNISIKSKRSYKKY
jgi:hypothetical protein